MHLMPGSTTCDYKLWLRTLWEAWAAINTMGNYIYAMHMGNMRCTYACTYVIEIYTWRFSNHMMYHNWITTTYYLVVYLHGPGPRGDMWHGVVSVGALPWPWGCPSIFCCNWFRWLLLPLPWQLQGLDEYVRIHLARHTHKNQWFSPPSQRMHKESPSNPQEMFTRSACLGRDYMTCTARVLSMFRLRLRTRLVLQNVRFCPILQTNHAPKK